MQKIAGHFSLLGFYRALSLPRPNTNKGNICNLVTHFSTISDFRVNHRKRHKLIDIMIIAVCALIYGKV
ncbi:MAG: transposase family protein [Candidatus Electrothrix sp. LOE2]|nr:transposase family protein [Candidatus Electrothrix sp. LOE2]